MVFHCNEKLSRHICLLLLVFLLLLCFAPDAFANAGSPLLRIGTYRLMFFNILIAIGEGLIISLMFRAYYPTIIKGTLKIIGIIVLANYFSWLAGEIGIITLFEKSKDYILADNPLGKAPKFILIMVIASFVVTIILEWPFCLWALRRKENRLLKSAAACLLVNICSYAFLVYAYEYASSYSVYTKLTVQPTVSFSKNNNAWVYFISRKDGNVYRIHPDGSNNEKIVQLNINTVTPNNEVTEPLLFVWPPDKAGNNWDLWISNLPNRQKNYILLKNFAIKAAKPKVMDDPVVEENDPQNAGNIWDSMFMFTDLQGEDKSDWILQTRYWSAGKLYAEKRHSDEILYIGFETPFLEWISSNITMMPGGQVVYQLGDQIVLLDLNKRLIGLVTVGASPVVVLNGK